MFNGGDIILVACDCCGETFRKRNIEIKRNKYNFCSRACYASFRKENKYVAQKSEKNLDMQRKLRYLADLRRKKFDEQRVEYKPIGDVDIP